MANYKPTGLKTAWIEQNIYSNEELNSYEPVNDFPDGEKLPTILMGYKYDERWFYLLGVRELPNTEILSKDMHFLKSLSVSKKREQIMMLIREHQQTLFQKLKEEVLHSLDNIFLKESFEDWCEDMEAKEWGFFEEDEILWKVDLLALELKGILKALSKYQSDYEETAYNSGYEHDNNGVDIREWSSNLTTYLRKGA